MPAIRDLSWTYTTIATGTTISIPLPNYQTNDLLLAIITADTGTGSWSSSGWTVVSGFPLTNTTQIVALWKIAGSSESDPTFTRSASETFNGTVISIQDVNTTTPIHTSALANAASYTTTFPTVTTSIDNCLIIWAMSHSATSSTPTPNIGPIINIIANDGAAESQGIGWGIQNTAGTTATPSYSSISSAAAKLATIAIAPPSGGATILPAYCAGDSSILLDIMWGTSAYNGNTTGAQDPTTIFGTSLQGLTLVSDTGTATQDVGLNPFNAVNRVTADTNSPTTWRGTRLQLASANRPNMTGKALLVHTGPSTPGQAQRLRGVSFEQGIAIGMASGAASGNWNIWHVHGVGTAYGASRDVPLVIHPDNTTGIIGTAGTFDKTSVSDICFLVCPIVLASTTTIWDFYSMWALDTITIAGGLSATPVDITGTVTTIQGHIHHGVIHQGSNQMLVLMPIQFGNGGTDLIYLDFNNTAIEFPQQYNTADKVVNFCTVDNWVGITYYAGSNDTISHRNSIISSSSYYKWGLHSSSSTSATYDFGGLIVVGAGTVSLKSGITFDNTTWSQCDQIPVVGATLINCTFKITKGTSAILVANVSEFSEITNCTFSNNSIAIILEAAGTYTSDGNIFTSNTTDIDTNFTATTCDSYSQTNQDSGTVLQDTSGADVSAAGQSFVGNGQVLSACRFYLKKTGSPTGNMTAKIYAHSGTFGTSSIPTGSALATSETRAASSLTTSYVLTEFKFHGSNNITLTNATHYIVVIEYSSGSAGNTISIGSDTSSPSASGNGSTFSSSTWTASAGTDYCFYVYTSAITIDVINNGSTPSYIEETGISITVNNSVTIAITILDVLGVPIQNARVAVYKSSDSSELNNSLTNSSGIISFTFNYSSDTDIDIRTRRSTSGDMPRYFNNDSVGTIISTGFSATIVMIEDTIVAI